MNAKTDIELAVLESAIAADIKARFPDLRTVEFYREDRKTIPVPAVLLELVEWEHVVEDDPGTEQISVLLSFEAEIIIGFRDGVGGRRAKSEVRTLVSALGAWMHNRRWQLPGAAEGVKVPTGPVQIIGAYPDDFAGMGAGQKSTGLDRFEVFRLTWQQKAHLGQSIWVDGGETPSDILYSWDPEIGNGNADKYESGNAGGLGHE